MADMLHIACPSCDTVNRVPAPRLGEGGTCGKCKKPLFTGAPVPLTAGRFAKHANADLPLLVDFWAAWCGPCRSMAPVFEAAAREFEPRVRFAKVDTDAEPEIAAQFQIRGIPTLVLIGKGREIARVSGAMPAQQLRQWLSQQLAAV